MCSGPTHVCSIVPEHLLRAIAEYDGNPEAARHGAQRTLTARHDLATHRQQRFAALSASRGQRAAAAAHGPQQGHGQQSIVPEYMLKQIVDSPNTDEATKARARDEIESLQKAIGSYQSQQGLGQESASTAGDQKTLLGKTTTAPKKGSTPATPQFWRGVYDAKHDPDEKDLPGAAARLEGQAASKDKAVNEAYDNVGQVLKFYKDVFGWTSIDNHNMHVISSVHFADKFQNAFWDPQLRQMVFGDGGDFLYNFTGCLDVIGHELTHAVTEYTSPLDYQGQSGALNEHVSDVFGIMIKHWANKTAAKDDDWLIGEGCLLPDVAGVALRSMKAPGTAYNDKRFGKDPQPDNFSKFKPTSEDDGGVHIYSGIPNRAFYLVSIGFGGNSWEKPGQIWWKALNSHQVPPRCTFLQFADVTVDVAEELFGDAGAKTVADAWKTVGVVRKQR